VNAESEVDKLTAVGRIWLPAAVLLLGAAVGGISADGRNTMQTNVIITSEGKTSWRVYVPSKAGMVERFARDELKKYVKRISGADFADADQAISHTMFIGLRQDLKSAKGLPNPKPGADGYAISVSADSVIIAGDDPRGVLYGVYDLLERLGCRWYYPTLDPKDPEVVPKNPNLSLSTGKWSESARIQDRFYWTSGLAFWVKPERAIPQLDWAAKNRYNGLSWQCITENVATDLETMRKTGILAEMEKRGLMLHGPGHSFPFFLSTEKCFKEHPEWFGMLKGERKPHGGIWPAPNFCMSNPQAREEFIRNVVSFAKKHPEIARLDLLPVDGAVPCECPECAKSTPTDLLVGVYNEIADLLAKVSPGMIVDGVPGYGLLANPPDKVFPNGKWQAVYAHWGRNHATSYDDPDYDKRANMIVWQSYFPRFMICSYYAANSHEPFSGPPYLHSLEGDTKFMVEHGVTGAFVLEFPFGFWWNNAINVCMGGIYPYYYPKRDPRSEVRHYALNYYGPKAGPILAEFYLITGDNRNLDRTYRASRGEADEWDVIWLADMRSIIARAKQLAAKDPVYAYRVSKLDMVMEMLADLGPSRNTIIEIEKAAAEKDLDDAKKEEIRKKIADARTMITELLAHGERLAAMNVGLMDGDWLKGWMIERTFTGPLKDAEKKLKYPIKQEGAE